MLTAMDGIAVLVSDMSSVTMTTPTSTASSATKFTRSGFTAGFCSVQCGTFDFLGYTAWKSAQRRNAWPTFRASYSNLMFAALMIRA